MTSAPRRGQPANQEKMQETIVGPFRIGLIYRHVGADEGPTLHIFGPKDGQEEEILRFDCFRDGPHYHLGFSYRDYEATGIEAEDPFAWAIKALEEGFSDFVSRAGADAVDEDIDRAVRAAMGDIGRAGATLTEAEAS